MRHKNAGRKFGRNSSHRRAMFRNLAANLFLHERITPTDEKAKELRRVAERLITKARRLGSIAYSGAESLTPEQKADRLAVERELRSYLPRFVVRTEKGGSHRKVDIVERVMVEFAKRFADRPGGYTRIVRVGARRGDNADMSVIELLADSASSEVAT